MRSRKTCAVDEWTNEGKYGCVCGAHSEGAAAYLLPQLGVGGVDDPLGRLVLEELRGGHPRHGRRPPLRGGRQQVAARLRRDADEVGEREVAQGLVGQRLGARGRAAVRGAAALLRADGRPVDVRAPGGVEPPLGARVRRVHERAVGHGDVREQCDEHEGRRPLHLFPGAARRGRRALQHEPGREERGATLRRQDPAERRVSVAHRRRNDLEDLAQPQRRLCVLVVGDLAPQAVPDQLANGAREGVHALRERPTPRARLCRRHRGLLRYVPRHRV